MSQQNPTRPDKMQRDIWTPRDAAEYLMVTEEMVTKMARAGQLRGTKLGVLWRFHRKNVVGLMYDATSEATLSERVH